MYLHKLFLAIIKITIIPYLYIVTYLYILWILLKSHLIIYLPIYTNIIRNLYIIIIHYIYIFFAGFSFAFPVTLTVPLAVTLLISACGLRNEDPCIFQDTIPDYLYWECPDGDFLNDFISNQHAWIWIVWLLSQTWIGIHIFMPHCERLAPTEKLFVTPMYLSLLIGNF